MCPLEAILLDELPGILDVASAETSVADTLFFMLGLCSPPMAGVSVLIVATV